MEEKFNLHTRINRVKVEVELGSVSDSLKRETDPTGREKHPTKAADSLE